MAASYRLKYLVDSIPTTNIVLADVGTDHGFLPIYAVETNKASEVFATDINAEPLQSANANIKKAKLNKKILTLVADGITWINDSTPVIDWVTISGLGSNTIFSIITNDSSKILNYAICSNNDPKRIREWAKQNNYLISFEHFIVEANKPYWVIHISKQNEWDEPDSIEFGDHKWNKDNKEYKKYLLSEINKLEKIKLKTKHEPQTSLKFENQIKQIKEYLIDYANLKVD